jgi:hypothetical protein
LPRYVLGAVAMMRPKMSMLESVMYGFVQARKTWVEVSIFFDVEFSLAKKPPSSNDDIVNVIQSPLSHSNQPTLNPGPCALSPYINPTFPSLFPYHSGLLA